MLDTQFASGPPLSAVMDSSLVAEFDDSMAIATAARRLHERLRAMTSDRVTYRVADSASATMASNNTNTGTRLELSQPRVFISYTHIDDEFDDWRDRVQVFAAQLRRASIIAELDAYVTPPPSWSEWMYEMIEDSDFVLVICNERYGHRSTRPSSHGKGTGAGWEGAIITGDLYDDQSQRGSKFIPVILAATHRRSVPYFLRQTTIYDASNNEDFQRLVHHLRGVPPVQRPPLGW